MESVPAARGRGQALERWQVFKVGSPPPNPGWVFYFCLCSVTDTSGSPPPEQVWAKCLMPSDIRLLKAHSSACLPGRFSIYCSLTGRMENPPPNPLRSLHSPPHWPTEHGPCIINCKEESQLTGVSFIFIHQVFVLCLSHDAPGYGRKYIWLRS